MAVETHLDELIDFKDNVRNAIIKSPTVVGLMLDKADPDMNGVDDDEARKYIYDFLYVDETNLAAKAYILIDADVVYLSSGTIKDIEVYVDIFINKSYMELPAKKWKARRGNRLDNIMREIDILINGSREFGIGRLQLTSAKTIGSPAAFSARELTYRTPDFARDRKVGIR